LNLTNATATRVAISGRHAGWFKVDISWTRPDPK
jgi:hypothetical protein